MYKRNNKVILDQFLSLNFLYLLDHYLSFKLFLKIIKLINKFNALNLF